MSDDDLLAALRGNAPGRAETRGQQLRTRVQLLFRGKDTRRRQDRTAEDGTGNI
jgi:hypothetical protein